MPLSSFEPYKEWKGTFYADDLPDKQMLRFYGERFRSVEINSTFYRMPKASVLETWATQVPADFKCVLKASQQIPGAGRLARLAARDHRVDPVRQLIQQFDSNFGILPTRARGHVKRMIRILKQLECCADTELFAERFQKLQVCEIITSSLQEEHRNLHIEEVLSALRRWLPGWMKRESEKREASHSGQRRCRLRLRRHSASEGFAARKKSKLGNQPGCFHYRRADRGMRQFRGVRPL